MLSERLRTARNKAGVSLRELESKIDRRVSAQAIGKYERGEMKPSTEVLELIAEALGVQKAYLTSTSSVELGKIEFRENKIRNKTDEKKIESTISQHLLRYCEIEEILDLSGRNWAKPRVYPFPVNDIRDAEVAALRIRDDWNVGSDPIPNLSEFLEERGFKIISVDMPEAIAGVTAFVTKNGSQSPVIVTSKQITGERQRFTIAHELAHLLLSFSNTYQEIEKTCDKFAGAFLMPARVMEETLGGARKLVSVGELLGLKVILGVSVQALAFRAKDLGIINQHTYRTLYAEFSRRNWLKPPYKEPYLVETERPKRFERLCLRALAEGIINKNKASELLDTPLSEVEDLFNGLLL